MNIRPQRGIRRSDGFTLLEVAIASAVLAVALFSILTLCATNLKTARALNRTHVDASSVAALLSITNKPLEPGPISGVFEEYPGYSWVGNITEYNFNAEQPTGLLLVELEVVGSGDKAPGQSRMQFLLFSPNSVRRASR